MSLSVTNLLKHIKDELEFLLEDSKGYSYESFINDKKTTLSYTRSFEIIGEACKNIPVDVRNANSHIDWKGFAGLRDIIIHQYFGIDYSIIWDTVKHEVPATLAAVMQLLDNLETQ